MTSSIRRPYPPLDFLLLFDFLLDLEEYACSTSKLREMSSSIIASSSIRGIDRATSPSAPAGSVAFSAVTSSFVNFRNVTLERNVRSPSTRSKTHRGLRSRLGSWVGCRVIRRRRLRSIEEEAHETQVKLDSQMSIPIRTQAIIKGLTVTTTASSTADGAGRTSASTTSGRTSASTNPPPGSARRLQRPPEKCRNARSPSSSRSRSRRP